MSTVKIWGIRSAISNIRSKDIKDNKTYLRERARKLLKSELIHKREKVAALRSHSKQHMGNSITGPFRIFINSGRSLRKNKKQFSKRPIPPPKQKNNSAYTSAKVFTASSLDPPIKTTNDERTFLTTAKAQSLRIAEVHNVKVPKNQRRSKLVKSSRLNNEWSLMAISEKVKCNQEKEEIKKKKDIKKEEIRGYLNQQIKSQELERHKESRENLEYGERIQKEVNEYKQSLIANKNILEKKNRELMTERETILNENQMRQRKEVKNRIMQEQRELLRDQKSLQKEKEKQEETRKQTKVQIKLTMIENRRQLLIREEQLKLDREEEQKLSRIYHEKLAKEERDRQERLKCIYNKQQKLMDLGMFAQKSAEEKRKEDEHRADRDAELKQAKEITNEELKKKVIEGKIIEYKKYYASHLQEKKTAAENQNVEIKKSSDEQKRKIEAMIVKEKNEIIQKRKKNQKYKKELEEQIRRDRSRKSKDIIGGMEFLESKLNRNEVIEAKKTLGLY